MDGNMYLNIYHKDETEVQLEALTKILTLAGYEQEWINFINLKDENLEELNKEKVTKNIILCINDTYKEVSNALCKNRGLPPFEFDSRKYHDHIKKLAVFSIPLSIEEMYSQDHKRNVWTTLLRLKEIYDKYPKKKIIDTIVVIAEPSFETIVEEVEAGLESRITFEHVPEITDVDFYNVVEVLNTKLHEMQLCIDKLMSLKTKTKSELVDAVT